jgi:hypothetical protein
MYIDFKNHANVHKQSVGLVVQHISSKRSNVEVCFYLDFFLYL